MITKETKLKPKEREFVERLPHNNFNGTKTVKQVFKTKNDGYARFKAHELITKPNVKKALEVKVQTLKEALIAKGITPERIADRIDLLLDSDEYQAVDKGLTHATKIYGVEDLQHPQSGNTYNILFASETQAEIKAFESKLKAKLLGDVEPT